MASVKYGCLHPAPKTKEYPVAASQYFYHNGVPLVYLDGSGNLTLALTATATAIGVAIVPTGRGAGTSDNYWLSSSTAGADKLAVIDINEAYEFLFPADTTVTVASKGDAADLVAVNDGTATYVNSSASSTDMFIIRDVGTSVAGGAATDVVVICNPAKRQTDT